MLSSSILALAVLGMATAVCFAFSFSLFPKAGFVPPKHAPGVEVVDFARHDLPKIRMGERTNDLTSGVHFVSSYLRVGGSVRAA